MAILLYIESSTNVCSVAVSKDMELLSLVEIHGVNSHSSQLAVCIEKAMLESTISFKDLNAVVVSQGPGSYTGLRIGVSTAKGICYGADIPLIAVNTLESMVYALDTKYEEPILFCPMLDARRMEVYMQLFNKQKTALSEISSTIIDENTFSNTEIPIVLFGDGSLKCKDVIKNHLILYNSDFKISAKGLIEPGLAKYNASQFEDLAYFEPHYLKEFVAGLPKIKGLT